MPGATIRIYLIDGKPLGPRTVEKSNWNGAAIDFHRKDWSRVRDRIEFTRPGVYVLSGPDSEGGLRIYVGHADELRTRIGQHNSGPYAKEYWERATAFTSSNPSFNKAHAQHLESRLVGLAATAKQATLENGNVPSPPALSESDVDEAETFLGEMLVIYPLLGINAFVTPTTVGPGESQLTLSARGVLAKGADTAEGFVVRSGSTAAGDTVASIHPYLVARRVDLIEKGVLIEDGQQLRLTQDYTFDSPSTAAGVMLGRNTNGRAAWKDEQGRSLKDIQEAAGA